MDKFSLLEKTINNLEHAMADIKRLMGQSLAYVKTDPESSLTKSRTILEKILIDVYQREMEKTPPALTIEKIIGETQFANKLPRSTVTRIRMVQNMGNIGVHHHEDVHFDDALDTLENVCKIFGWYLERYNLRIVSPEPTGEKANSASPAIKQQLLSDSTPVAKITPSAITVLYKKAQKLYGEGKFEAAIADYSKVLEIDPNYVHAWFDRADAKSNLGQKEAAIADYSKVLEIDPNYVSAWYNRGLAKHNLKQYEAAIADFSRALELDPEDAGFWTNRAEAKRLSGQMEAAVGDYAKAAELNPENAYKWLYLASAKASIRQYEQAISDYSKAIEIDPKLVNAWNGRGSCKSDLGQYEAAIADFSNAIKIDSRSGYAWANRGVRKLQLNQYKEAIADFAKAIELDPKDAKTWFNQGAAYLNMDKYSEAFIAYDRAILLDTSNILPPEKYYLRATSIVKLWKPLVNEKGSPDKNHLRAQLDEVITLKQQAVDNQQYEKAADLRDKEAKLAQAYHELILPWNKQIEYCKNDLKRSLQLDIKDIFKKDAQELLVLVNSYQHPLTF